MSIQIIDIVPSHRKNKKFKAVLSNGTQVHFGLKNSNTFIDKASLQTRNAYLARHLGNKIEKELIDNLVMSPSLLSAYILWNTNDLDKNVEILNKLLKYKNAKA